MRVSFKQEEASSSGTLRYGAVDLKEDTNIYCGDYTANDYKPFSMVCAVASNIADPSGNSGLLIIIHC